MRGAKRAKSVSTTPSVQGKDKAKELYDLTLNALKPHANTKFAEGMKKYMKNRFNYLGIQAPTRKEVTKELWKPLQLTNPDPEFYRELFTLCFESQYREMAYTAIDFTDRYYLKLLSPDDLPHLEKYTIGQWWDVTDLLAKYYGIILCKDKELREKKNKEYLTHPDMWMRRTSLLYQMKLPSTSIDHTLYFTNLTSSLSESDWFMRKAIGWALREYSKDNPQTVIDYIRDNKDKLSGLSRREGLKYISNRPEKYKHVIIPKGLI